MSCLSTPRPSHTESGKEPAIKAMTVKKSGEITSSSMGFVSLARFHGVYALLRAASNGQYNKDSHSHKTDQRGPQHVPEKGLADALQEPSDRVDNDQWGNRRLLGTNGQRDERSCDKPAKKIDPRN